MHRSLYLALVCALGCGGPSTPASPVADETAGAEPERNGALPAASPSASTASGSCGDDASTSCRNGTLTTCDCLCSGGDADACATMGALLPYGTTDTPADPARAVTYLERACTLGSAHGCGLFGTALLTGMGTAADRDRAIPFLRRACLASGESCSAFAEALDDGSDGPDMPLVAAIAERTCASADAESCARLGRMYEAGRGGLPRDPARAFRYYVRGIGTLTQAEIDAQARASALAQTACDGGVVEACVMRGLAAGRGGAALVRRAATLRDAECTAGDGLACIALVQDGDGLGTDEAARQARGTRALIDLDRACAAGNGWACLGALQLGEGFGSSLGRDDWTTDTSIAYATRGVTLLRAACEGGDGAACAHLGDALLRGYPGLGQDYAGARAAFDRGCRAHDEDACTGDRGWRPLPAP